jgi:fucose 4-O-acetylase-like acetyltransferase
MPISGKFHKGRYVSIDLLKGVGVISFIAYHVGERFSENRYTDVWYLAQVFVTSFFIFSSGFMVGFHYYHLNSTRSEYFLTAKRLLIRAGRLFTLVFLFGTSKSVAIDGLSILSSFKNSFYIISSLVIIDRWDVPFQALLVISLTLAASAVLLSAYRSNPNQLYLFVFLYTSLFIGIDCFTQLRLPYLWRYIPHGILGIPIGIFFKNYIFNPNRTHNRRLLLNAGYISMFLFLIFEIFVLSSTPAYDFVKDRLFPNIIMNLCFFSGFGLIFHVYFDHINTTNYALRLLKYMGKRTLLIYIAQGILINVASKFFFQPHTQSDTITITFAILAASLLCCLLTDLASRLSIFRVFYNLFS